MKNKRLIGIVITIALLLCLPLIAMQLSRIWLETYPYRTDVGPEHLWVPVF